MANVIYPKYKDAILSGAKNVSLTTGNVKVALTKAEYSPAHEFLSDVKRGIVGTPQEIADRTVSDGLFNGAGVSFTAVTGHECTAFIIYIDTGAPGTSRLVAYLDNDIAGLPITPNGGDIAVAWNNSGIFQL